MEYVNWFSIIIAAICSSILGNLWYSPILFGNKWKKELNITQETLHSDNNTKIFGIAFLMAFVYSYLLAKIMILTDFSGMADGFKFGFMIGACFSAMSLGINYQYSKRSTALYFIDAGFMVTSSTIMGAVIGVIGN